MAGLEGRTDARGLCESDWLPMPIHGWHLEAHVRSAYAKEIADGILVIDGPDVATLPTMSFRTVLPATPQAAPFIKLPVALWMTSEQRSLQAKSIHMGPRVSTVIERILEAEDGFGRTLEIFPEEVAWHYRNAFTQDDAPGKHLSVVFRASVPAFARNDGCLPVTVATLFTQRPDGRCPLFTELVETSARGAAPQDAAQRWFRQYARTVTRPVIAIYLLYGIALEAHQQNTQVLFDTDGMAQRLLVRDLAMAAPMRHCWRRAATRCGPTSGPASCPRSSTATSNRYAHSQSMPASSATCMRSRWGFRTPMASPRHGCGTSCAKRLSLPSTPCRHASSRHSGQRSAAPSWKTRGRRARCCACIC